MQKNFTQSCKLVTWTTCKLVTRNHVVREAWKHGRKACGKACGKKACEKHFFPVTEKVIT
jgi:hypothetical protein